MLLAFLGKVLDDFLTAFVGILTYKKKKIAASIIRGLNTFIFLFVIAEILKNPTLEGILIISFASTIGRYLGFVADKFLIKDAPFYVRVSYKGNKEKLQPMIDQLRDLEYDVHTFETFYKDQSSSLGMEILSETRKDSVLIESLAPDKAHVSFWEVKNTKKN